MSIEIIHASDDEALNGNFRVFIKPYFSLPNNNRRGNISLNSLQFFCNSKRICSPWIVEFFTGGEGGGETAMKSIKYIGQYAYLLDVTVDKQNLLLYFRTVKDSGLSSVITMRLPGEMKENLESFAFVFAKLFQLQYFPT
jgi:hypothetical protein